LVFICEITNPTGTRYPSEPDGYGYEFLPMDTDTGTNFYPQPLYWRTGNYSTWSKPDPLPSLDVCANRASIVSAMGKSGSLPVDTKFALPASIPLSSAHPSASSAPYGWLAVASTPAACAPARSWRRGRAARRPRSACRPWHAWRTAARGARPRCLTRRTWTPYFPSSVAWFFGNGAIQPDGPRASGCSDRCQVVSAGMPRRPRGSSSSASGGQGSCTTPGARSTKLRGGGSLRGGRGSRSWRICSSGKGRRGPRSMAIGQRWGGHKSGWCFA
jgi:hypothetical protein